LENFIHDKENMALDIPNTRVLAISDLHLGSLINSPESLCNFTDNEICNYLFWALKKYDIVILNGDVFDNWEEHKNEWKQDLNNLESATKNGVSFAQWEERKEIEKFLKIEQAYPQTVNLIRSGGTGFLKGRLVYINGNHDAICRSHGLIPIAVQNFTINSNYPIHFAHGHMCDVWNNGKNSCLECCSISCYCCYNVAEDILSPNLDQDLIKLADTISNPKDQKIYIEHSHKLAEIKKYSCVVYGHTHVPDIQLLDDGFIYANTGKVGNDKDHNDVIDEIEIGIYADKLVVTQQERHMKGNYLNIIKKVNKHNLRTSVIPINVQIKDIKRDMM
jgi:metallophosphoesterase superfamily enzyme